MYKSGNIFPYLQINMVSKSLLNFYIENFLFLQGLSQNCIITVTEEKCWSFKFVLEMFKKVKHI